MRIALMIIWFFGFPFVIFMFDYFLIRDMKGAELFRVLMLITAMYIWLKATYELYEDALDNNFIKQITHPEKPSEFTVLVLVSTPGETTQLRSFVTWNMLPKQGSFVSLTSPYGDSKQYVRGEVKEILMTAKPLDNGETHIITVLVSEQDFRILKNDLHWESFE